MTDKKKTNKRKISTLVKQQVPEFVLSEHPKFTEFLSSYFLFMESAELNLESITDVDNILLETETDLNNFVLLDRTDAFGLDAGDKVVAEENTFISFWVVLEFQIKAFFVSKLYLKESGLISSPPCLKIGDCI